jgi:hypothetical protein
MDDAIVRGRHHVIRSWGYLQETWLTGIDFLKNLTTRLRLPSAAFGGLKAIPTRGQATFRLAESIKAR